jgi:hypothetical protein
MAPIASRFFFLARRVEERTEIEKRFASLLRHSSSRMPRDAPPSFLGERELDRHETDGGELSRSARKTAPIS